MLFPVLQGKDCSGMREVEWSKRCVFVYISIYPEDQLCPYTTVIYTETSHIQSLVTTGEASEKCIEFPGIYFRRTC